MTDKELSASCSCLCSEGVPGQPQGLGDGSASQRDELDVAVYRKAVVKEKCCRYQQAAEDVMQSLTVAFCIRMFVVFLS